MIRNCFQSFLPGPAATVENVEPVIKEEANHLYLPPAVATTITTKRHKVKAEVKEEEVVDEGRNIALPGSAEDADVLYARALQAQYDSPRASRSIGTKSTAKRKRTVKKKSGAATETMVNSDGETVEVKKKKRAVTNNGFNKLLTLSDELAELLGVPYLSRPQVSKQIWAYIKAPERNLQDPNDKRYINCDDRLTALLGTPRVHMFSMTKILQKHMRVSAFLHSRLPDLFSLFLTDSRRMTAQRLSVSGQARKSRPKTSSRRTQSPCCPTATKTT